ncbi:MAG: preprotein translocase subunit SecE [Candidatus Nealsonbacteria bacterium]|nr:preprotein translocase subunit SecE [Candidatus Nealsonbacteria bacterium]
MKPVDLPKKIVIFLKEVRLEIKKVNWPTKKELVRYTLIIVGVSVAVAIFLGGLDIFFQFLRDRFIL